MDISKTSAPPKRLLNRSKKAWLQETSVVQFLETYPASALRAIVVLEGENILANCCHVELNKGKNVNSDIHTLTGAERNLRKHAMHVIAVRDYHIRDHIT